MATRSCLPGWPCRTVNYLRLQGPDANILQFEDILLGLMKKIHSWNRRVNQENFAMFENLYGFESGFS